MKILNFTAYAGVFILLPSTLLAFTDTTPPSKPANVTASAITSSQIQLKWTASTDNVGVAGYQIYRNWTLYISTPSTSFLDTGLTAGTDYTYTVVAYDAAGNTSPMSNPLTTTTNYAGGTVRQVGPGKTYTKPCQAILAALPGDTIEIDAGGNGTYNGDVCMWTTSSLIIRGVNGRAHIDAAGNNSMGKGTWVISGSNTIIENVELSGAVCSSHNGAAIRQQGANLTLRNSYIHNNQDGILTNDNSASNIVIESSEFSYNGYGDGYTHNIYVNNAASFTLRYSYSHYAKVGHLVKSRAQLNYILYNRLSGENGTDSYELDLPNGGTGYVIGNVIQQGPYTNNPNMLIFGEEGPYSGSQLFAVNNTFVNDLGSGSSIHVDPRVTTSTLVQNNITVGSPAFVTAAAPSLVTNCEVSDPLFTNPSAYDYTLQSASPCINAGSPAGVANGVALTPAYQYVHKDSYMQRPSASPIDAGAFEH